MKAGERNAHFNATIIHHERKLSEEHIPPASENWRRGKRLKKGGGGVPFQT